MSGHRIVESCAAQIAPLIVAVVVAFASVVSAAASAQQFEVLPPDEPTPVYERVHSRAVAAETNLIVIGERVLARQPGPAGRGEKLTVFDADGTVLWERQVEHIEQIAASGDGRVLAWIDGRGGLVAVDARSGAHRPARAHGGLGRFDLREVHFALDETGAWLWTFGSAGLMGFRQDADAPPIVHSLLPGERGRLRVDGEATVIEGERGLSRRRLADGALLARLPGRDLFVCGRERDRLWVHSERTDHTLAVDPTSLRRQRVGPDALPCTRDDVALGHGGLYRSVRSGVQRIGHAHDAVVRLGDELWVVGSSQPGRSAELSIYRPTTRSVRRGRGAFPARRCDGPWGVGETDRSTEQAVLYEHETERARIPSAPLRESQTCGDRLTLYHADGSVEVRTLPGLRSLGRFIIAPRVRRESSNVLVVGPFPGGTDGRDGRLVFELTREGEREILEIGPSDPR